MKKYLNLIQNAALLSSLTESEILDCLNNGSFMVAEYPKNKIAHFEGEVCSKLEIILSGKLTVDRIDESGNLLTVAEFFTDDIVGGNLLFSSSPLYFMTITAKQKTVILSIEKSTLFKLFTQNQSFLESYLMLVSDNANILGDKIKRYIKKSIRESVLSYLEIEAKHQNTQQIKLDISKKELAEKFGVQRTSLSRELAKMKNDGLILYDANTITLL